MEKDHFPNSIWASFQSFSRSNSSRIWRPINRSTWQPTQSRKSTLRELCRKDGHTQLCSEFSRASIPSRPYQVHLQIPTKHHLKAQSKVARHRIFRILQTHSWTRRNCQSRSFRLCGQLRQESRSQEGWLELHWRQQSESTLKITGTSGQARGVSSTTRNTRSSTRAKPPKKDQVLST